MRKFVLSSVLMFIIFGILVAREIPMIKHDLGELFSTDDCAKLEKHCGYDPIPAGVGQYQPVTTCADTNPPWDIIYSFSDDTMYYCRSINQPAMRLLIKNRKETPLQAEDLMALLKPYRDGKNKMNEAVKLKLKADKEGNVIELTYDEDSSKGAIFGRDLEAAFSMDKKEIIYKGSDGKEVVNKISPNVKIVSIDHNGKGTEQKIADVVKHVGSKGEGKAKLSFLTDQEGTITNIHYFKASKK